MGIFEDIAELFSEGLGNIRDRRESRREHLGFLGQIFQEEDASAPYRSMLAEIQDENAQRLGNYRQRLIDRGRLTIGEIESRLHQVEESVGTYLHRVLSDVMEHEGQIESMMQEHMDEFGAQSPDWDLEPVNWKKEGF